MNKVGKDKALNPRQPGTKSDTVPNRFVCALEKAHIIFTDNYKNVPQIY